MLTNLSSELLSPGFPPLSYLEGTVTLTVGLSRLFHSLHAAWSPRALQTVRYFQPRANRPTLLTLCGFAPTLCTLVLRSCLGYKLSLNGSATAPELPAPRTQKLLNLRHWAWGSSTSGPSQPLQLLPPGCLWKEAVSSALSQNLPVLQLFPAYLSQIVLRVLDAWVPGISLQQPARS